MEDSERQEAGIISRRSFMVGVGGIVALGGLGGLRLMPHQALVRPPGGQDEERLIAACIRCQRCYEICPKEVIKPAHIEDGLITMRTPTFDFANDYCDWCTESNGAEPLCVKACPTLALELPEGASPLNTLLGEAIINKDWCLAYRLTGCKFCYDACPYEAIELDGIGRPHIILEKCNGCGACESVCVSLRNASIASGASERAVVIRPLKTA
jgi:ferredoxin-type protein NapG